MDKIAEKTGLFTFSWQSVLENNSTEFKTVCLWGWKPQSIKRLNATEAIVAAPIVMGFWFRIQIEVYMFNIHTDEEKTISHTNRIPYFFNAKYFLIEEGIFDTLLLNILIERVN